MRFPRRAKTWALLACAAAAAICACRSTSREPPATVVGAERLSLTTPAGIQLSYLRAGKPGAARVIFVHGTPGSALDWRRFLENPPADVEAIAVDRPGFGETRAAGHDAPTALPAFDDQAAAIEPLLTKAPGPDGVERWPILVGHSLGGPIVARVAADYPERVGAIVILAGSLDPGLEKPLWYNYVGAIPPISWLLSEDLSISNNEIFAAPKETRRLAEVLPRVRCPVFVVHGDQDELVPVENVAYMRTAFTGARSLDARVLTGADHFLPWRNAAEVRGAIDRAITASGHHER